MKFVGNVVDLCSLLVLVLIYLRLGDLYDR